MNVQEQSINENIDLEQISESFQFLASCEQKLVNNEETKCHLGNIDVLAVNGGLDTDQLGLIVEQLTKLQMSSILARKLIHCLVPSTSFPASILVDLCLWGLGNGKHTDVIVTPVLRVASLSLQYDCVEDKHELASLYEMFLGLIARDKLAEPCAEILQYLTTSAEVTEWRIRSVLRCQAKQGSSHNLDSLVWMYRQWRPDLIPNCKAPASQSRSIQSMLAKRFHKNWEHRLDRSLLNGKRSNELWFGGIRVGSVFNKAQRSNLLPSNDVLPLGKTSRRSAKIETGKSVAEIKTYKELIDNIHNIQMPANIVSLLGNSACVQILVLDQVLVERFSVNIYHLLHNEFLIHEDRKISPSERKRKYKRRESILDLVYNLQDKVQQGLPVIGRFLTEYFPCWDGKSHFASLMKLLSQLQITDYKELHDCIISPILTKHFQSYTMIEQLVFISYVHRLLRSWGVVEMDRFTNHRRSVFPINTVNCTNALESMYNLSVSIAEMSTLALALARERFESSHLLSANILGQYKLTQVIMMKYNIPLRLDLPSPYLYESLFSYSGDLLSMSCSYILMAKKTVLPALRKELRDSEIQNGNEHPTTLQIEAMLSEESKEELLAVTRDFLVFLSPGQVNLTHTSLLRQCWDIPEGEEALKESMFISSHPAMLPWAVQYMDSLELLTEEDRHRAWEELSTEQDDTASNWVTNINMEDSKQKIGSVNFYAKPKENNQRPSSNRTVLGNLSDFLRLMSQAMPAVYDLIMEYKKKSTTSVTRLPPPFSSANVTKDTDLRSIISQQTVDSGVESLQPRPKRRSREKSGPGADENRPEKKSRRQTGTPRKDAPSKIPRRDTRKSAPGLKDASNKLF